MIYDLQKASILKRISAGLLDFILTLIIATGAFFLLSSIFNYDALENEYNNYYETYAEEYGFDFREVTEEMYNQYNEEQKQNYDNAYKSLTTNKDFLRIYNKIINLSLLMITFGVLIAILIVEFLIPLFLKNGQTVGKKVFGICLMMDNGVRIRPLALLVRSILGKFTVETMITIYTIVMLYFGNINVLLIFILAAIYLAQIISIIVTHKNALLHDLMAYTVVVDKASQMIFNTQDELIKYKQDLAEKNARSKKTF